MFAISLLYARGLQTELLMKIEQVAKLAGRADDLVAANLVLITEAEEETKEVLGIIKGNAILVERMAHLVNLTEDRTRNNAGLAQEIQTNVLAVLKKLDVEPDGWRGSISLATEEIKQCVCGDAEKVGADG
ncbi:MAG TPA: hypothetical protein VM118_11190, partial [Acidobacteriota bacterium]|nr:hypothetical protein [Acidobacteriota bacterium]